MRSAYVNSKGRISNAEQHYGEELKDGPLAYDTQCHSGGRSTKPVNRKNTPSVISDPFSNVAEVVARFMLQKFCLPIVQRASAVKMRTISAIPSISTSRRGIHRVPTACPVVVQRRPNLWHPPRLEKPGRRPESLPARLRSPLS